MNIRKSLMIAAALAGVASTSEAVTIFSDTFGSSTLNSATPGAPTATSTDYAILADKNTSSSAIAPNDLKVAMASTSTGRVQAQARFATTPVTLGSTGDYVELTITFNNTLNLLTIGNNSYLAIGLFNSGGAGPVAGGVLANTGLPGLSASPYATGNAAGWQGYNARLGAGTLSSRFLTRPLQDGSGTTPRNQDVVHPGESSGYNNPSGTQIGSTAAFGAALIQGETYTYALRLTLNGSGLLDIKQDLHAGAGTAGPNLFSLTGMTTGATTPTLQFDSLGFGWKHSPGSSTASTMDVSLIEVTAQIAPIPEPTSASLVLMGAGMGWLLIASRRRSV